jgi:PKD repeat protein
MSETANSESTETAAAPKKSMLKAILGTLAGALSAAVMAWLSPLVTNAVKPAKPVANFAAEHKGLEVTFQNRSTGGSKLCWDFGDDSALEFLPGNQAAISHTYAKTGKYHVKLTVSNILGDSNERAIDLDLSDTKVSASAPPAKPEILDLHPKALGNSAEGVAYAPATFQFLAIADNAQNLIWDFGDATPAQSGSDQMLHTYLTPGQYRVRLCAYNGREVSQKEVPITVQSPPTGGLTYTLRVTDQGTPLEVRQRLESVSQAVPLQPKKGPAAIERLLPATAGYEITRCELKQNLSSNVQRIDCQVAPNHQSAKLVAYLSPVTAPADAVLNQKVLVEEQRRGSPMVQPAPPLLGTLAAPGRTMLRLPPTPDNWTAVKRQITLEISQGNSSLWRGSALPNRAPINLGGRQYFLTASLTGDKFVILIGN